MLAGRLVQQVDAGGCVRLVVLPRSLSFRLGLPVARWKLELPPTSPSSLVQRHAHHPKKGISMSVQIRDNEAVQLSVSATDSEGNPAQPGGLTWSVSDGSLAALVADSDGSSHWLVTKGGLGTVTVTVSDDEDGDPSTAEFLGSLAIDIVAGPVAQIEVNAGTPVGRDEAPSAPDAPPVDAPPVDVPPVDAPPADAPPVDVPPVDVPPADEPPVDVPPVDVPPVDAPPADAPPTDTPTEPVQAAQAVYEHSGDDAVDPSRWPVAPFTAEDGSSLYFFADDTVGAAPTGDGQDGFSVYSGALVPTADVSSDVPQPDAPSV